MTIDALINLTDGTLQNEPTINAIEGASVFYSKIEHGDLFISSDKDEIDSALNNGAYAIIYDDESISIKDPEIAWIKVHSIQDAAFKLLRYVILEKEADFFLLSEHESTFLKMILLQKSNISFISSQWRKAFEQILNSPQKLFVGTNEILMKHIKPDIKKLTKEAQGYLVNDTLFRSTFKIGNYVYQDRELVPFHLDYLLRVVELCDSQDLPYSIDRVKYTKHFVPVFIDGDLNRASSAKSDRVVIFADNLKDINQAREYIKYNGTWVKSIVLTPPKVKVENITRPIWFETEEDVRETLKNVHFNYAFVYTLDRSILNQIKEEYTLF